MSSPPPLSGNPLGLGLVQSQWIEFAITTIILIARLYARAFLVRRVGWDDYLMITAFFVTLGAFILNNLAANAGFGIHAQDLAPQYITEVIKWAFLGQVLGIMGSAFARMAFIVTLIQLLSPNQKIQLWMLRVFFFFNLTVNTATSLYILLQCKPTYGLWDKTVNPVCLPPDVQEHLGFFQGAVICFSDLALAIFPATIIWKLNMKLSLKLSLCATMGLGVFAFVVAIIKTVNLTEISADPNDPTFILFGIQFWFCLENTTLIISASIPTLKPFFNHGFKRGRSSQNTPYNRSNPHTYQRFDEWREPKAAAGLGSLDGASDQIELTGGRVRGTHGTDTECVAVADGGENGLREAHEIPETGIMKTVNAYVTH